MCFIFVSLCIIIYATFIGSFSNEQNLQSNPKPVKTSWRESVMIRNWLVLVKFSIYESCCEAEIDHCVNWKDLASKTAK